MGREAGSDGGGSWRDEPSGLWLDGDGGSKLSRNAGPLLYRRGIVAVTAVVLLASVAIPAAFAMSGSYAHSVRHARKNHHSRNIGTPAAKNAVLAALSATVAAGNFNVSYKLSESGPRPTLPNKVCPSGKPRKFLGGQVAMPASVGARSYGSGGVDRSPVTTAVACSLFPPSVVVIGSGTIDVAPYAMGISADLSEPYAGYPSPSMQVSLYVTSSSVCENSAGLDYGGPSCTQGTATSSVSGFSSLVEGALGSREGAVAMIGMASPTGYLDLAQNEVTAASQTGTSTIGGVPVSDYTVQINTSQIAAIPGLSSDQEAALHQALGLLESEKMTTETVTLAIDSAGFIRQDTSVANFADGASVTLFASFSNFGCAGQASPSGIPSPQKTWCVSPDKITTKPSPTLVPLKKPVAVVTVRPSTKPTVTIGTGTAPVTSPPVISTPANPQRGGSYPVIRNPQPSSSSKKSG
ncbi:MAG: hypothetical protein M0008_12180 [Actinomycetota bacterium]|nr:hypothetical protein [Actinomycetota bacterium]